MTPEEMEAEIVGLREQVSQLRQRQEAQDTHWLWMSRISAGFGLALAAVSAFVNFRSPGGSASIVFVMGGMTLLLLLLASAFGSAARHTSKGTNASLRNFAPWALVVLLLLALFTLFQLRAGF